MAKITSRALNVDERHKFGYPTGEVLRPRPGDH